MVVQIDCSFAGPYTEEGSIVPSAGSSYLEVPFAGSSSVEVPFAGSSSVEVPFAGSSFVEDPFAGSSSVEDPFASSSSVEDSWKECSSFAVIEEGPRSERERVRRGPGRGRSGGWGSWVGSVS